ncbi:MULTISPECIES: DUF2513 domain-containing protein [Vibrio]|uniref:DUF2513 domain-containing protein n=1 Tax=Vibrio crassostreae TaxID=246167 RepID=A0A822N0F5_9VIBR|nr:MULTISPECIES: DUF2513 domain-containing protein [Vibrio]MBF4422927.1 DUF2513 domain-containing protein [Vibrio anguillarum]MDH5949915.1 DUF2513 domain-containing protein [Vibrio crassostreae]TCN08478.1 uncharacterized protein DUF2513 [Vibrio crassostreae]TCN93836.1 uncharacterized protein DUF2513 [Vibrio crassostreae]TCT55378.1 uncharacterized protein DUF2513 [Vibrio crassostreae]
MRVDFEYIKDFLALVLDNEELDFNLNQEQFKPLHADFDAKIKMVFHLEILEDQGLIESVSNRIQGLGFQRSGRNDVILSFIPLRLTATGHQFAADLVKPGVLEKLVDNFKDAGPTEAVKVVLGLGKSILEKKLAQLTE